MLRSDRRDVWTDRPATNAIPTSGSLVIQKAKVAHNGRWGGRQGWGFFQLTKGFKTFPMPLVASLRGGSKRATQNVGRTAGAAHVRGRTLAERSCCSARRALQHDLSRNVELPLSLGSASVGRRPCEGEQHAPTGRCVHGGERIGRCLFARGLVPLLTWPVGSDHSATVASEAARPHLQEGRARCDERQKGRGRHASRKSVSVEIKQRFREPPL